MVWFVNEHDITKDGCPVAQPRFTSRPSAKTVITLPFGQTNWSTCGLISTFLSFLSDVSDAISISRSKCPMLQTIACVFIASMCLRRITSVHFVAVLLFLLFVVVLFFVSFSLSF